MTRYLPLLLLASCSAVPEPSSWHMELALGDSVDAERGAVIEGALAEWRDRSGGRITTRIVPHARLTFEIVVEANFDGSGFSDSAAGLIDPSDGTIRLERALDLEALRVAATHELGHLWTPAPHSAHPEDVMFPTLNDTSKHLTARDLDRLAADMGE